MNRDKHRSEYRLEEIRDTSPASKKHNGIDFIPLEKGLRLKVYCEDREFYRH